MSGDEMLPIPGLEPEPQGTRAVASLEKAVRRTLAALQADGLIEERHAARVALAIELAQIVTMKRATGRVSTVANDARVLMELLDKLLPDDSGIDDALRSVMREWSEVIARGDAAPEVRDTT